MSRRRLVLGSMIALLLAVNVFLLLKRRPYRTAAEALQPSQIKTILEWESLPVVALNEPLAKVEQVIKDYPRQDCLNISNDTKLSFDQLPSDKSDALFSAIAALLQCYETSTSTAVVSYMQERKEQLDPKTITLLTEELVNKRLATREELKSTSATDIFAKVWSVFKCNSHWKSIVEKAGCACLWRCRDPNRNVPLGEMYKRIFENVTNNNHLFQPNFSFQDACKQSGGVLVADMMVVIEHDEAMKKARSPYFFRFWYSERDGQWHPLQMKQVIAGGAPTVVAKVIF